MDGSQIFYLAMDGVAVVPAVRMTQGELRGKRTPSAKQRRIDLYLSCKEDLSWRFKMQARKLGLKTPLSVPVTLSLEVHYTDRRKRDLKNIVGTIEDALVAAKVIEDDALKYLPKYKDIEATLGHEKYYLRVELLPYESP